MLFVLIIAAGRHPRDGLGGVKTRRRVLIFSWGRNSPSPNKIKLTLCACFIWQITRVCVYVFCLWQETCARFVCNLCVKFIRDFNSLSYLRNRCCEIELSTCLRRDVESHLLIVNALDTIWYNAYTKLVCSELMSSSFRITLTSINCWIWNISWYENKMILLFNISNIYLIKNRHEG